MFIFVQNFVIRVINAFDVSAATVRVSVSFYGYEVAQVSTLRGEFVDALIEAGVNDQGQEFDSSVRITKEGIIGLTERTPAVGGTRRLGHALEFVCDNVFQMNRDLNPATPRSRDVPKVVVVLSGGRSADEISHNLSCFNQYASGNQQSVTIIGVGQGTYGADSLRHNVVQHLISITIPQQLLVVDNDVVQKICESAAPSCQGRHYDVVFLLDG